MAAELVYGATSEKLAETDWTKNIEICELVAHDKRYPKISFPYSVLFLSDWTIIFEGHGYEAGHGEKFFFSLDSW